MLKCIFSSDLHLALNYIKIDSSRFSCKILPRETRGSLRWRDVLDRIYHAESSIEFHIDADNDRDFDSHFGTGSHLVGVRFRYSVVQLRGSRASNGSCTDGDR